MDSIDIAGKKYISSKQAAKLTGYAQDYVGQLARGGKVPGTRVGRTWYIDEEAILLHAGVTPAKSEETPTVIEKKANADLTTSPAAYQSNTRSLHSLQNSERTTLKTWGSINYLDDTSDLLPLAKKSINSENQIQIHRITKENIVNSAKQDVQIAQKNIQSEYVVSSKTIVKPRTSHFNLQLLPLALTAPALALLLVTSALSGIYTPETLFFSYGVEQIASVEAAGGVFDPIWTYLVFFFKEGISLFAQFIVFFLNSIQHFFNLGVAFFLSIFN